MSPQKTRLNRILTTGFKRSLALGLSASLSAALLSSCAFTQRQAVDPSASLYDRLGGRPGLTAVVEDFTRYISEDERINGFFIGAEIERINRNLYDQICQATGGPCVYKGRDMVSLHTGMNITEAQFNALVEDLIKSMNHHGVPAKEQQELLAILGPMKKDIINR